jgi:hypothetical protein
MAVTVTTNVVTPTGKRARRYPSSRQRSRSPLMALSRTQRLP